MDRCGSEISSGRRFHVKLSSTPSAGCDLCDFFQNFVTPDLGPQFDLCAYSARVGLGVPSGLVPDTVMLGLIPDRRHKALGTHPLQSGRIVMECLDAKDRFSGRRIGSQVDFGLLKSWLSFCTANHTQLCRPNASNVASIPGFRVIDCQKREVALWSELTEASEFAALSYVWGDVEHPTSVTNKRLPRPVPRTIEDALKVTLSLGYKYLWVDRYCVPQNDDKEKHNQIQKMNLIYGSSAVTIIAAAGADPTHGLPGVGRTKRKPQAALHVGNRILVATKLNLPKQVESSKWSERGWTYQEAYLSTRRLVFTDHMVYFHCRAMHCPETISAPLAALHTRNLQRLRDCVEIGRVWPLRGLGKFPADLDDRILEYAKKRLSYPSDALNAFEGVFARFEAMKSPVRNLCGIPIYASNNVTASLIVGLSWQVTLIVNEAKEARLISILRGGTYSHKMLSNRRHQFPSWTWIGWDFSHPSLNYRLELELGNSSWPAQLHSKFQVGKSSLRPTVRLVDVDVQMADGMVLPWASDSDSHRIMDLASSTSVMPKALHISGFTLDAWLAPDVAPNMLPNVLEWNTKKPFRDEAGLVDAGILNLNIRDLSETALASVMEHRQKSGMKCIHIRFLMLGIIGTNHLRPYGDSSRLTSLIMVLYRKSPSSWERLNVLRRWPLSESVLLNLMRMAALKSEPNPGAAVDDREFKCWKWRRVVVV